MTFTEPVWIAAGLAAALLVAVGLLSHARRRRRVTEFLGGARAARRLSGPDLGRTPAVSILLLGLAAAALGLAAAGPRWSDAPEESAEPEPSVVLALDVSGSMQARDVAPTRLGGGVAAARELLASLEGRRVGLLMYAGKPYVLAPPTRDHALLRYFLDGVTPDVVSLEDPGTLVSEALVGAERLLADSAASPGLRSVVLLGDGETGEDPAAAAATARALAAGGVRVHAVGVGTPEGSEVVLPVGYQRGGRLTDGTGAPVVSRLREDALRGLADAGGGRYAASDDADALRSLVRAVGSPVADASASGDGGGAADSAELPGDGERRRADPAVWLMAAALVLLLAESLLDARIPGRGRTPRRTGLPGPIPGGAFRARAGGGRAGVARAAVIGALALGAVVVAGLVALDRRSVERANRLYRSGEPGAAGEIYRLHAERSDADPVALYGLGTALLAAGDTGVVGELSRAAERGDSVLAQRAHYNLGRLHLARAEAAAAPGAIRAALQASVRHGWAALELDPDDADALWNLELAQLRLRELLRRTQNLEQEASGDPVDLAFEEGDLMRAEEADTSGPPPTVPLPPSQEPGGPESAESLRVLVEGAEEARAGGDPGALERGAALDLVRRRGEGPEHLVRRLLWIQRPSVDWWSGEAYPGGRW